MARVEANLPETSTVAAQFLLQMHIKKMFDLEQKSKCWSIESATAPLYGKYQNL